MPAGRVIVPHRNDQEVVDAAVSIIRRAKGNRQEIRVGLLTMLLADAAVRNTTMSGVLSQLYGTAPRVRIDREQVAAVRQRLTAESATHGLLL